MPLTYNVRDAADRLGVSKHWLREFLRRRPADDAGVPFYVPIGSRKRFTERDLERILEASRDTEKDKLLSARTVISPSWPPRRRVPEESREEADHLPGDRLAHALVQLKK